MIIEIGGIAIAIRTPDSAFQTMLRERYRNFEVPLGENAIALDIELVPPCEADSDLSVKRSGAQWKIDRGDFHATYDTGGRRGTVRQTANPWSIDTLIRIVHSLELAPRRGFLLHAASAVLANRAFVFTGVSGAGKTTISRLAPTSATLLTDEISYVRQAGENGFAAWGTPFAGELGTPGENVSAPVAGVYFLEHAVRNRISVLNRAESLHRLMRNILFFAEDAELVQLVFETAAEFLERVPAYRLEFKPDNEVWRLIE